MVSNQKLQNKILLNNNFTLGITTERQKGIHLIPVMIVLSECKIKVEDHGFFW